MRASLLAPMILLTAAWARAGVYSTVDKPLGPLVEASGVKALPRDLLTAQLNERRGLRSIQGSKDSGLPFKPTDKLAKAYAALEEKIKTLQDKQAAGRATVTDQINLSAYLIELGRFQQAAELLEPLAREGERSNFMLLSNLATAYQSMGQLERAGDYLQQARDCWPKEAPGFTPEQLAWLRRVEDAQLRLARLRRAETARHPAGNRRLPDSVDNLFGPLDAPLQLVGPSGAYEAGTLAPREKAKLPKEALPIVQQLVLWFPSDTRLYWLYGELLNANGDVKDAYSVLDDCLYAHEYNSPQLREHRRILDEAIAQQRESEPPPASVIPETRKLVLIGGAVGVLALVFGYLQLREFRRRRMASPSSPSGRG